MKYESWIHFIQNNLFPPTNTSIWHNITNLIPGTSLAVFIPPAPAPVCCQVAGGGVQAGAVPILTTPCVLESLRKRINNLLSYLVDRHQMNCHKTGSFCNHQHCTSYSSYGSLIDSNLDICCFYSPNVLYHNAYRLADRWKYSNHISPPQGSVHQLCKPHSYH